MAAPAAGKWAAASTPGSHCGGGIDRSDTPAGSAARTAASAAAGSGAHGPPAPAAESAPLGADEESDDADADEPGAEEFPAAPWPCGPARVPSAEPGDLAGAGATFPAAPPESAPPEDIAREDISLEDIADMLSGDGDPDMAAADISLAGPPAGLLAAPAAPAGSWFADSLRLALLVELCELIVAVPAVSEPPRVTRGTTTATAAIRAATPVQASTRPRRSARR